jgi:pyrroline-5-carboxylate reductase
MKIGFAGAGNMAAAMARGWAAAKRTDVIVPTPESLAFTDAGSGRATSLAEEVGGEALGSNRELAQRSDALVLAVKPGALDQVAEEIADAKIPVISLLGATSLDRLAKTLPGVPVMRLMPNLAVEVRRGVLCHACAEMPAALRARLLALLEQLGTTIEVDDSLIDAATAVMGCSPAYFALVAETLIDAGVREGLTRKDAARMVARTLAGTGELLDHHEPTAIRAAVASPGGSTEAGLAALEERDAQSAFEGAVEASLARMRG